MKFLRFLGAAFAVIACLHGSAFGATVTVSTGDALYAALKAAAPGDVVQLADGSYPVLNLYSNDQYPLFVKAAPGVTVSPAPGAHPVIGGLSLTGAQGLTFRGLDVQMTPTQQYGVFVGQSGLIVLDGLIVHQADGSLQGVGVFARESRDVTVSNSELHHLGVGVSALDTARPCISASRFHDIESDGIDFAGDPEACAIGNRFTDFHPLAGDHPDAIQFWPTAANPLASGAVVKDNVIERGNSLGWALQPDGSTLHVPMGPQGVFVEGQANITITGNGLLGTMYNGIGLSTVQTALVADNFVQGFTDMATRIITRGQSSDVTLRNNSSQAIVTVDSEGPFPNYAVSGTIILQPAAVGDTSAMDAWLAAKGVTLPAPAPNATVDPTIALNAQISSLTANVVLLTNQISAMNVTAAANAAMLAAAQTKIAALRTSESQIKALAAQGKAAPAKSKNGYFDQITSNATAALAPP